MKLWQPDELLGWLAQHQPTEQMRPRLWLLSGLALLNLIAVATSLLGWTEPWWYFTFVLYFGVYMLMSKPARSVFHEATALQGAIEQLASVVGQLESYSYADTPHLRELCSPFLDQSTRPTPLSQSHQNRGRGHRRPGQPGHLVSAQCRRAVGLLLRLPVESHQGRGR